jgi:hypothetical protein
MSREEIKTATGSYPISYRSPILTPSYPKDMRYLDVVEKVGFTIDSSLLRRYIDDGMLDHKSNVTIVPASFSDSELVDQDYLKMVEREHFRAGYPLVVVFHLWRLSETGHFQNFEILLDELESTYRPIEYLSIEEFATRNRLKPRT